MEYGKLHLHLLKLSNTDYYYSLGRTTLFQFFCSVFPILPIQQTGHEVRPTHIHHHHIHMEGSAKRETFPLVNAADFAYKNLSFTPPFPSYCYTILSELSNLPRSNIPVDYFYSGVLFSTPIPFLFL